MTLSNSVSSFLRSITFFSRLPLPESLTSQIGHGKKLGDAAPFFPVAGLVIGLFPAVAWWATAQALPAPLAAAFAIVVGLVVTGALHEDGLADCADGLGATSDRERALEIMRDSRIGSYGALALMASFTTRVFALAALSPTGGFLALLIAHSVSRAAIILAMRFSGYARREGLGSMVDTSLSNSSLLVGFAIAGLLSLLLAGFSGIMAAAFGLLAAWVFLHYLKYRIGGYTGDGLGAMQQLCEITILACLAGFWA